MVVIILLVLEVIILIVQPYKRQFASYNIVDAIIVTIVAIYFAGVTCMIDTSVEELRFESFSVVILGITLLIPPLYVAVIGVRWLYVRIGIGKSCIAKMKSLFSKDPQESTIAEWSPDRLENPGSYENATTPLLAVNRNRK